MKQETKMMNFSIKEWFVLVVLFLARLREMGAKLNEEQLHHYQIVENLRTVGKF